MDDVNLEALEPILDRVAYLEKRQRFGARSLCFDKQLSFIEDKTRFKTAACSRKAGKTFSCAVYLLETALRFPRTNVVYITLSRGNAKRIIWKLLLDMNRSHHLDAHTDETELAMDFPNGSTIYLTGAKDKVEVEKFRGLSLKLVIIDESQSFRPYLKDLVDDALMPCLWDVQGTLCLIGTPGCSRAGTFFESCVSKEWSHHHWTILDNPWIEKISGKKPEVILEEERRRRGITEDDPTYQRECLGRWVEDKSSLVFKFDSAKNVYDVLPQTDAWDYVVGVDIGHEDADAVAVLGWTSESRSLYLCEEHVRTKQTISELGEMVKRVVEKYEPHAVVVDTGGLGKKIAEELKDRWGIYLEPAEKTRKLEHIELLNDALRTGALLVKAESRFAQDAMLVEWTERGFKVSETYHSDITDAVLYAFRACKHYTTEIAVKTESEMDLWEQKELAKFEAQKTLEWWESM